MKLRTADKINLGWQTCLSRLIYLDSHFYYCYKEIIKDFNHKVKTKNIF